MKASMERHEANPEMLTLARTLAGLSQKALADRMGLRQSSLSKYEAGSLRIPDDIVPRLSQALDRPESFFYRTGDSFAASAIFHRRRKGVAAGQVNLANARLNLARLQMQTVLRAFRVTSRRSFFRIQLSADRRPSEVAKQLRAAWQLPDGPVRNVTAAIEAAGGIVWRRFLGDLGIDGVSQWPLDEEAFPMILVSDEKPGDRLRWTLAHEIGHLVMHHLPTDSPEDEADIFAAEFLMPADEIASELKGIDLKQAAALKSYWKVSMKALIRRARQLEIITDSRYRRLMTELSTRGYHKCEPVAVKPEEPALLPALVRRFSEKLRDRHGLRVDLGATPEEFEADIVPLVRGPSLRAI